MKTADSTAPRRFLLTFLATAVLLAIASQAFAADQKTFATPMKAVQALVKAAEDGQQDEIIAILGDEGRDLVYSGDAVQDRRTLQKFVKDYKIKNEIIKQGPDTCILQTGANNWPMPIPIVNDGGKWRFDTAAGKEELLFRRIGHNELGAIAASRGFIDAQKDYASVGHDDLPAGIYARKLMSAPGKQDGLYWETADNQPKSPAGPLLAEAGGKGYDLGTSSGQPYHGYLYRILTAQGSAAKGGAKNYLVDDKLKDGVALVAYPAEYRVSGVTTFIINQNGVVYQKDLGPDTKEIASSMTDYNPDSTWKKVLPYKQQGEVAKK